MTGIIEGPLSKWTNVMKGINYNNVVRYETYVTVWTNVYDYKGWQYRWFVLDDNAGLFSYYTVCYDFVFLYIIIHFLK